MRTQNQQNTNSPKKRDWIKWVMLGVIVILIILLCLKSCGNGDIDINIGNEPGTAPTLDPNQGDYITPETPVANGVAIPGWGRLTIPIDTAEDIVVDFYNPSENADKYYLTFELRIPADNEPGYEVLYTSGLIAPGKHIQKINLTRGLPAGTYNAILHVQPYRMSDKSPTNNADLKLELVVK